VYVKKKKKQEKKITVNSRNLCVLSVIVCSCYKPFNNNDTLYEIQQQGVFIPISVNIRIDIGKDIYLIIN